MRKYLGVPFSFPVPDPVWSLFLRAAIIRLKIHSKDPAIHRDWQPVPACGRCDRTVQACRGGSTGGRDLACGRPDLWQPGTDVFAYTGFAVIANSAEDMKDPKWDLPRAMHSTIVIVLVLLK